jgi:hypothetical protein
MGLDEEGTLAALSSHRARIDVLIARHAGRICGTAGDSVLAEFVSVFAAVECAVAIQAALERANADVPEDRRMVFRIGINVGDVLVKDGDIFGEGVNIAARLQAMAEPGGICISRSVRDHVRHKLPYALEDRGEHRAKNIARPVRVFRLLRDAAVAEPSPAPAAAESGAEHPGAPAAAPRATEIVFWESIKDSPRLEDYQAYVRRYPAGSFIELARTRLREFAEAPEAMRDPKEREIELAFWESARDTGNAAALRAYLEKYPNGEFNALAEIRLRELARH